VSATPGLEERQRLLSDELGDLLGVPVALDVLKEKPGRRHTLRASGPRGSAIVKTYASARAPTVGARVHALGAGPAEPRLPEVLMVLPALRTVVLSEVPGRPLRAALRQGDAESCRRAGRAIGAWHLAWRSRPPALLRPHSVDRELELLDQRARGVRRRLAAAARAGARELDEPWAFPTVVHRDLYEEHVLLGDHVGLIDVDDAALGPPELDIGNLLAHVQLLSLRSRRDLGAMTQELLAGYADSGAMLDAGLLERCRRLALLRLACIHNEPALLP
jgi:hypothetical protein